MESLTVLGEDAIIIVGGANMKDTDITHDPYIFLQQRLAIFVKPLYGVIHCTVAWCGP